SSRAYGTEPPGMIWPLAVRTSLAATYSHFQARPEADRMGSGLRIALRGVLAGALTLLCGAAVTAASRAASSGVLAAQGDFAGLVAIGGRRLSLECRGTGSPTVVLEAGGYARGDFWSQDFSEPAGSRLMVLPAVAGYTRVCAYDRPGTIRIVNPQLDPSGPE